MNLTKGLNGMEIIIGFVIDLLITLILYTGVPLAIGALINKLTIQKAKRLTITTGISIFVLIFIYNFLFAMYTNIRFSMPSFIAPFIWSWVAYKILVRVKARYVLTEKPEQVTSENLITCPKCGTQYPASFEKCIHCGHIDKYKKCARCKKEYAFTYSTCPFCGCCDTIQTEAQ